MMASLPQEKLEALETRFQMIEEKLAEGPEPEEFVRLSKEYAELEPIIGPIKTWRKSVSDLAGARDLLKSGDAELRGMAEAEIGELEEKIENLTHEIRLALLPKDADDERSVILEIRAGTGGDEAALFAGDLFRMYTRYAELQGWKVAIVSESEGEVGGYKEVIANITGHGVFAKLKFESGVHRVQRVPETEAQGRIHTSAATVAVLPEVEDIELDIKSEDIRIDTMRASGAGGQHVNKTDSAVRLTHIPSGIVIVSAEKSQHQNRAIVMKTLKAKLYELERNKRDSARSEARREQVGSGDRSGRIRTYNFPQGRVTDHRINLTLYKLDKVIAGEALDEMIEALITDYQAAQLAAMDEGA